MKSTRSISTPPWLPTSPPCWRTSASTLRNSSPPITAFAGKFQNVLVEGAGGWEVPITESYFISDLAKDLGLPVILIAANRLGALNHILLSLRAIEAKGLRCAGIVLNQLEDEMDTPMITNKGILESLTDVPLLDHIIHGQDFLSPEFVDVLVG